MDGAQKGIFGQNRGDARLTAIISSNGGPISTEAIEKLGVLCVSAVQA
jgi:hypothetical protein